MAGLTPEITLTNQATGEVARFEAQAEGEKGHYVATLTLPSAGEWQWEINAFGPPAQMSPLQVVAPAATPTAQTETGSLLIWLLAVAIVVLGIVGGSVLLARWRRLGTAS